MTKILIAFLFAAGMLFGTGLAAQQPAQPEDPPAEAPAEPGEPTVPGTPGDEEIPAEPGDPEYPTGDEPADPLDPIPGVPDPADPDITPEPDDPIVADPFADDFFGALVANPELTAFAQAFEQAGLHEVLAEEGEWTVFAPADSVVFDRDAFAAEDAFGPYIVQGAYSFDALWELAEAENGAATLTTIDDRELSVEILDGVLLVGGAAQITQPDIQVANGYLHVVDATYGWQVAPVGGAGG